MTISSRFRLRSLRPRLRGMTTREKPAKWPKRLKTNNPRKTTVRTFQIALERGRGGRLNGGGVSGGGVPMTGGGAAGGGGLAGGAWDGSGVGG